jgi:hypothetical protein
MYSPPVRRQEDGELTVGERGEAGQDLIEVGIPIDLIQICPLSRILALCWSSSSGKRFHSRKQSRPTSVSGNSPFSRDQMSLAAMPVGLRVPLSHDLTVLSLTPMYTAKSAYDHAKSLRIATKRHLVSSADGIARRLIRSLREAGSRARSAPFLLTAHSNWW